MSRLDAAKADKERRTTTIPTGMAAIVGLVGFLMVTYGLFVALERGTVLQSAGWIAGGFLLEVASGAFGHPERPATGLVNPFALLSGALRHTKERVRGWEKRE